MAVTEAQAMPRSPTAGRGSSQDWAWCPRGKGASQAGGAEAQGRTGEQDISGLHRTQPCQWRPSRSGEAGALDGVGSIAGRGSCVLFGTG